MANSSAEFDDYASERIHSLLAGFRLLEAAGACELVAGLTRPAGAATRQWWSSLAATARGYRRAIFDAAGDGFAAIEGWAAVVGVRDDTGLADARSRLNLEYEYWLNVVGGSGAYVAWLSAYVAAAELDGHRAADALGRSVAIASDFLGASDLAVALSVYEQLQLVADLLPRFLPLSQHPLRDMRRFALLPTTFPT